MAQLREREKERGRWMDGDIKTVILPSILQLLSLEPSAYGVIGLILDLSLIWDKDHIPEHMELLYPKLNHWPT